MSYSDQERTELEYELLFGLKEQVMLFERMCPGQYTTELKKWLDEKIGILEEDLPEEY